MRLLLLINHLGCGGTERVLSTLANAWAERGHEITVLTLENLPLFYPLNHKVTVIRLGLAGDSDTLGIAITKNRKRIRELRARMITGRPNVCISFMPSSTVLAILASLGTNVPIIVCEHSDTAHCAIGLVWAVLRILTYPFASAATFLTANVQQRWKWLGNTWVMPNPVKTLKGSSPETLKWPATGRHVLAVGRLAPVKGYDKLIAAFARISKQHPDWSLTLLGEGSERSTLERQVVELGLLGRVAMPGAVNNPFGWMAAADFLVMSSRYEGFPCVLGEALACGLPAVSFDCDSGPRDIIRHGIDGLLVEPNNVEALAAAMARMMEDDDLRRSMALRAPEVLERFSLDSVLEKWDQLFAKVLA
jgi:GalNAc-alpha-(1->4)-GalNAc-alpha-(1->3)-diNAcBac-PP-undecaprenol alpha-1,4-N-acetyl-D-galactosaminyltransferase